MLKKKIDIYAENAREQGGVCADAYEAQEALIGTILLSGAYVCWAMTPRPRGAAACWASLIATYAYLQYDLENNFWCRCMYQHYNGVCVY